MSNENGVDGALTINGIEYIGLATYADVHGMDVKRLRRHVRKSANTLPVRKWGAMWLIETDCEIVIPETRSRGKTRVDGRTRWIVYMLHTEHDAMLVANIVPADCIVNPRDRAKQRRDAKLAMAMAAAAVTDGVTE